MGIYYRTVLLCDAGKATERSVELAKTNGVIDAGDIAKGYVLRSELRRVFGYRISEEDISAASRIVEQLSSTLEEGLGVSTSQDLPIVDEPIPGGTA